MNKPPKSLTIIVTTLEQVIYRYNPLMNLKAELEDAVKEIKKVMKEEKRRATSVVSSSAKVIYEHIKVNLSTKPPSIKALDSKLSDIQHGQSKIHNLAKTLSKSLQPIS